jgi:hypothetical protein
MDAETKSIHFDVVLSFEVDPKEAIETLIGEVKELVPDYTVKIVPDVDISD